jgi:acetyl-CoA carboxylase biotin carboxyl carrier protein
LDLNELKEILQILEEKEIAEFELEEQGLKLRIRKAAPAGPNHGGLPVAAPLAAALPSPPAGAPSAASPGAAAAPAAEEAGLTVVRSPMVGTFYRRPDPTAPSFVEVGDQVHVGQILCIIEAMKLMNEIEAEVAGEITKVHHENGQPVQYGDPLFTIRPS